MAAEGFRLERKTLKVRDYKSGLEKATVCSRSRLLFKRVSPSRGPEGATLLPDRPPARRSLAYKRLSEAQSWAVFIEELSHRVEDRNF